MKKLNVILCSAVLCAPLAVWGAEKKAGKPGKDLPAVLARMRQAEAEVKSLTFQYKQKTVVQVTNDVQDIQGKAFFRRPAQFRVEHSSPRVQSVISDGKTLWFYNPMQGQVLVDNWENWSRSAGFPKGLMPVQMDVTDLEKRFTVELEKTLKEKTREGALLKLTPKEAGPWPYHFRVWVDLANGLPYRTEMKTQSLISTTEMDQIKVNPALSDEMFTFKTPAGVQEMRAPASEAP